MDLLEMKEDIGNGKTKSICSNNNKNHKPQMIYQVKLSFRNEVKIKAFPDTQKLREYVANRFTL